jgi:hypothetical protein
MLTSLASLLASPRPAVLLLGDSRDRVVYGHSVGRLCTGTLSGCAGTSRRNGTVESAEHCYSWQWAAPAHFPIASYYQSGGGALCRSDKPLAAFAYLIHYGVSSSGPYLHDWRTHGHEHWAGVGWMDVANSTPRVNSAALAAEAAARFARRAPENSRVCIVYASLMWDLGRHRELFHARQPWPVWQVEFARNYTAVVEQLSSALHEADQHRVSSAHRSVLALTAGYDVPNQWAFYEQHDNASLRMVESAAAQVLGHATRGIRVVDLYQRFRDRPDLYDKFGHPTLDGVSLIWDTIADALKVSLIVGSDPACTARPSVAQWHNPGKHSDINHGKC